MADILSAASKKGRQVNVEDYVSITRNSPGIKNIDDYLEKLLKTFKRDGKTLWLEEGIAKGDALTDYGMAHIWDKHHPSGQELAGRGSKFPDYFTEEDITDLIDNVINNGTRQPYNPKYPGQYAIDSEFDFGSVVETVRITLREDGRILSAFPLRDVK